MEKRKGKLRRAEASSRVADSAEAAEADFKRNLHAGNVILSPQAAKTLKAAGITVDDMIAMLLKDLKGLQ